MTTLLQSEALNNQENAALTKSGNIAHDTESLRISREMEARITLVSGVFLLAGAVYAVAREIALFRELYSDTNYQRELRKPGR